MVACSRLIPFAFGPSQPPPLPSLHAGSCVMEGLRCPEGHLPPSPHPGIRARVGVPR